MSDAVLWTSDDAAAATGGRTTRPWQATGVAIDSRSLQAGELFVAIRGPNFDGHAFVADALGKGAAAAVVAHRPDDVAGEAPLLIVDDPLAALCALGRAARTRGRARVVGVTGSVGKTGTKEALRLVLGRQAACHANLGSLNNHWGLPLSLARLPRDAAYAVFEMGMNHPGEIAPLSDMARPDVAVITTVEAVHSAHFDSTDQIAAAKAEIFDGMESGGTAVLNRDNPHFEFLAARARHRGLAVVGFGEDPAADVRLEAFAPKTSEVTATVLGQRVTYRIGAPGRHWAINSLAVLGAVAALGASVAQAAAALADLRPPQGRGERLDVPLAGGPFTVVDDSYNASPVSVTAALRTLGGSHPGAGGRRIAVLGDMLELGPDSGERHAALAAEVGNAGLDLVFTAGTDMARLFDALPTALRGGHAETAEQVAALVADAVGPGDLVLVKGSAGSRMKRVVEALRALGRDTTTARAANGD